MRREIPLLSGKHRDGDSLTQQQQQMKLTRRCNAGNTSTVGQHLQTSASQNDHVSGVKEQTSTVAAANGNDDDDDAIDPGRSDFCARVLMFSLLFVSLLTDYSQSCGPIFMKLSGWVRLGPEKYKLIIFLERSRSDCGSRIIFQLFQH